MHLAAANPMLPTWLVLIGATLAGLAITAHLSTLRRAPMPSSRRRIRTANGVVLLGLTALLAYALGFVETLPAGGGSIGHIRSFVIGWMAIMGLVPIVLGLAILDVLNTVRLRRAALRRLRRELRGELLQEVEVRIRARLGAHGRVASAGVDGNAGGAVEHGEHR
jgi:hypothetical protein